MILSPSRRPGPATLVAALGLLGCAGHRGPAPTSAHAPLAELVRQVQRADYQGDRAALARLHEALRPFAEDGRVAARVRYWRGFALWRRAINGFNETSPDPADLERDLVQAADDFGEATALDPAFTDAQVGAVGSLGLVAFLHAGTPARLEALRPRLLPLLQALRAAEEGNPRVTWVLGPQRWNTPAERGWGPEATIASYERALAVARRRPGSAADGLAPAWGEPELLMSLAWSQAHRSPPDLAAAERHALEALALVPDWHYVRDILLPQIRRARAASASGP